MSLESRAQPFALHDNPSMPSSRPLALFILILVVVLIRPVQGAITENEQSKPVAGDVRGDIQTIAGDYIALNRANTLGDVLPNRSAEALATLHESQDRLLKRIHAIDPSKLTGSSITAYAILLENMESLQAVRACRAELWDINHITGWQVGLPPQAASQSVKTSSERERALRRWSSLPGFIDTDLANLRTGMANGYSVPKTVVGRVLRQIDGLLNSGDESPFAEPARKTDDAQFRIEWRLLVSQSINPAIKRFGDFLRNEYLPRARESIGLSALPDGERCYAALLRSATTLDRSPRATFDLGQATVRRSRIELRSRGRIMFGTENIEAILQRAKTASANRFKSSDELLSYSEAMLIRSTRMSATFFFTMPQQPIEIAPMPNYQRNSGISSHYEAVESLTRPAFFRINLDDWVNETRGAAAVTVVHEAIPGHHLQTAIARTARLPAEVSEFSFNAAYVEGWANYVERLCDEAGIYDNPYAAIFRRSVLGESLMIDPAVHVMGWTRGRVRRYLQSLGETRQEADDLIDRIAVQPAQLTSYETGGLEIFALREEAKAALGSTFDMREFHQRVLEQGDVPLSALRQHVQAWMQSHPLNTEQ
jgi:uncharacterized protein (DUF885 family)